MHVPILMMMLIILINAGALQHFVSQKCSIWRLKTLWKSEKIKRGVFVQFYDAQILYGRIFH